MITVTGTSKVDVNVKALEDLLNGILPDGAALDLEIKMDARGNVKSTFMKVDAGKCSLYTGAVETEWDSKFISTDNVTSAVDSIIFISVFAVKKALAAVKYDMKLANMANSRVEDDFTEIKGLIQQLVAKYNEIAASAPAPAATSSNSSRPARSKANGNPNAGKPLEDTPTADIPEDLDLIGAETPLPVPEAPVEEEVAPVEEESNNDDSEEGAENGESSDGDTEVPALNLDEPLI